jgi:DNA modification methylase
MPVLSKPRDITLYNGDAFAVLPLLPAQSVRCCVTSPPYYGLRDYGVEGQLGLEATPDAYVESLVAVFRQVRRVLTDDGTVWLNLGDSYTAHGGSRNDLGGSGLKRNVTNEESRKRCLSDNKIYRAEATPNSRGSKQLLGIPWRVAFALQEDGWVLRQDIIWAKPNPMPESVKDRCTKAHEYLFLLAKRPRYYYDTEAVKEDALRAGHKPGGHKKVDASRRDHMRDTSIPVGTSRNRRSVWTVTPKPFKGAHFAVMPEALVEPCVLAGSSERGQCPACGAPWVRVVESQPKTQPYERGSKPSDNRAISGPQRQGPGSGALSVITKTTGWEPSCHCSPALAPVPDVILDPFAGAGTVGVVARRHGRKFIGIELNTGYCQLARERLEGSW